MDAAVAVLALLVLIGGAVALLSKQRMLPWTFPALRLPGGPGVGSSANGHDANDDPALGSHGSAIAPSIASRATPPPSGAEGRQGVHEPVRRGLESAPIADVAARLDRIEQRLDDVHRLIARQGEALAVDASRSQAVLLSRVDADEARRDAAWERFRTEIRSLLSEAMVKRQRGAGERGAEVSAELYARVARLEASLSAVTNPILLPSEAYAPPEEFLPEALIWENWNEVGERVFALAEAFGAQRLHLSARTRVDVGEFVTTLRTLLTRSVYPNLQPSPSVAQHAALRSALEQIAAEIPKVRDSLEREYRQGRPV